MASNEEPKAAEEETVTPPPPPSTTEQAAPPAFSFNFGDKPKAGAYHVGKRGVVWGGVEGHRKGGDRPDLSLRHCRRRHRPPTPLNRSSHTAPVDGAAAGLNALTLVDETTGYVAPSAASVVAGEEEEEEEDEEEDEEDEEEDEEDEEEGEEVHPQVFKRIMGLKSLEEEREAIFKEYWYARVDHLLRIHPHLLLHAHPHAHPRHRLQLQLRLTPTPSHSPGRVQCRARRPRE